MNKIKEKEREYDLI